MNILVTGASGFIGRNLIPALIERGHHVRLLVRDLEKGKAFFQNQCDYFVGDVTKRKSLSGCCSGIDLVYHMAAKVGNELPNHKNLWDFRKVNVEGTRNLMEECKCGGIRRFIYISSIAAMGIVKDTPINEKSKCNPYLPYQISKLEAEMLVKEAFEKNGFPGICVRPTKVYGAGEQEYSYLTLAKLCKKGIFPKVGRGRNDTSNLYITDFVQGLTKLLDHGAHGSTYIMTSNESISLMDTGNLIADLLGKKITVIPVPAALMVRSAAMEETLFLAFKKKPVVTKKNIEAILSNRVYDIGKARDELHFSPQVSLREGIRRTVEWYVKVGLV